MKINFSEEELKVISSLCLKNDLSPSKIIKQALAQYQLVDSGIFELKEVNPLLKFPTFTDWILGSLPDKPIYNNKGEILGFSNER